MIKKVAIKDFMCVREATLEFGGFTIFIGKSDSGKSTFQRAIQAILENKMPASKYATHGKSQYSITVLTEKGVASITKGKQTQYNTVCAETRLRESFNAAGKDIPDKVRDILDLPKLPLSDQESLEVLYQSQHAPFFLISEDRSTFTKIIALISNADKLRELEKLCDSDIRVSKRTVTLIEQSLKDIEEVIAEKSLIVDRLNKFEGVEAKAEELELSARNAEKKIALLNELDELNEVVRLCNIKTSANKISIERVINDTKLPKKIAELSEAFAKASMNIPDKAKNVFVPRAEKLSSLYEEAFVELPEEIVVDSKAEEIFELKEAFEAFSKPIPAKISKDFRTKEISDLEEALKELAKLSVEIDQSKSEKQRIDESLKEFEGQTCPYCGSIIKEQ